MPLRNDVIDILKPKVNNNDQSLLTAYDFSRGSLSDLFVVVQLNYNQTKLYNHQAIADDIINNIITRHSTITVVLLSSKCKGPLNLLEADLVPAIIRGQSNYAILLVRTNNYLLLPEIVFQSLQFQSKPNNAYFTLSPLSDSQQRLAYLDNDEKNKAIHNELAFDKIFGEGFNPEIFTECLKTMYHRHDALRTSIHLDRMQQVIWPSECLLIDIPHREEKSNSGSNLQFDFLTYRRNFMHDSFKLEQAPLLRHKIIKLSNNKYRWWAVFHHSIYDGRSNQIFLNELSQLYLHKTNGAAILLPMYSRDKHLEYIDYSIWQNNLPPEKREAQLNFWKDNLKGAIFPDLPSDTTHPEQGTPKTHSGARVPITINKDIVVKLKMIANEQKTTLFNLLLTCYFILFFRYTGQIDITIGTMTANRKKAEFHNEFDNTFGFLATPLLIRVKIPENPNILLILNLVKDAVKQALTNSDLPFGEVIKLLQQPFAGPLMVLQDSQYQTLTLPNVEVYSQENGTGLAKFPLAFELRENSQSELCGFIEYYPLLFTENTVSQMVQHYINIIRSFTLSSESQNMLLHDIDFLTPGDKVLHKKINKGSIPIPTDKGLIQLLEDSFSQHHDKTAVIFKGITAPEQKFTFNELNLFAGNFSRYLLTKINKDNKISEFNAPSKQFIIGICLPRSPELIIAILAALKIDALIVPLDAEIENIDAVAYKLLHAQCMYVITTSGLKDQGLLKQFNGKVILIDQGRYLSKLSKITFTRPPVDLHKPRFRFFTSGTTGPAKALDTPDGGWCNWVYWAHQQPYKNLVIYISSPTVADAFMWDALLGLVRGFPIVLNPDNERLNSESITQLTKLYNINSGIWTPSNLSVIRPVDVREDSVFYTTGQNCHGAIINAFLKHGVTIIDAYGESEAVCGEAFFECQLGSPVRIGRPIQNRGFMILDRFKKPLPIGCIGELCVTGEYMGTYTDPVLTQHKFSSDPAYPSNNNRKVFYTGNKARLLIDGTIELLGRMNYASRIIKYYGLRVDLDALEGLLTAHPDIAYAAVKNFEVDKRQYIAAYFTIKKDSLVPTYQQLRSYLLSKGLPTGKIPTHFEHLFHMPTTPNGKVDYSKLFKPELKNQNIQRAFSSESLISLNSQISFFSSDGIINRYASSSSTNLQTVSLPEEIISQIKKIMSDLLQHPIEDDHDFIEYGGNSLLRVILVEKIMSLELVIRRYPNLNRTQLLRLNTLRQFAELFTPNEPVCSTPSLTELSVDAQQGPAPDQSTINNKMPIFVYIHDITGHCDSIQPMDTALAKLISAAKLVEDKIPRVNIPALFQQTSRKLNPEVKSIEETAAKYVELLKQKYTPNEYSYHFIGYSFGGLIAIEMLKLLFNDNQRLVESVVVIDAPYCHRNTMSKQYLQQIYQSAAHLACFFNIPCEEDSKGLLTIKCAPLNNIESLETEALITHLFDTLIRNLPILSTNNINVLTTAKYLCLAAHRYRPNIPLRSIGSVVHIIASEGTKLQYQLNDDLGWSAYLDELKLYSITGTNEQVCDHFSIISPAYCNTLSAKLFEIFKKCLTSRSNHQSDQLLQDTRAKILDTSLDQKKSNISTAHPVVFSPKLSAQYNIAFLRPFNYSTPLNVDTSSVTNQLPLLNKSPTPSPDSADLASDGSVADPMLATKKNTL